MESNKVDLFAAFWLKKKKSALSVELETAISEKEEERPKDVQAPLEVRALTKCGVLAFCESEHAIKENERNKNQTDPNLHKSQKLMCCVHMRKKRFYFNTLETPYVGRS